VDDLTHYLDAMTRAVKTGNRDGALVRTVIAARSYSTGLDDLWDTITNAERIPRWFLPVSGDLRLGGHYQLEGNAGGQITRCEPPNIFAVTWEFGGQISWVKVTLESETATSTLLRLEHTQQGPDDFWNQYGPGAVGVGWDMGLVALARYLQTGALADRTQAMAWMESGDGRNFMRISSDGWCQASIAGGADSDWARAAAERTRQAYSGETGSG